MDEAGDGKLCESCLEHSHSSVAHTWQSPSRDVKYLGLSIKLSCGHGIGILDPGQLLGLLYTVMQTRSLVVEYHGPSGGGILLLLAS